MAYTRWSTGDLYVYLDAGGYYKCMGCFLGKEIKQAPDGFWISHEDFTCKSTDELIAHLERHTTAGHKFSETCIPRLLEDKAENDKWLAGGDFQ